MQTNANEWPDLDINGVANAAGGRYRNVNINGVGSVSGDVQAEAFKVNGVITVKGGLQTGRLDADGTLKIEGRVTAGITDIDGIVDVRGTFGGDNVLLKGQLNVRGDCELERLDAEGGFRIDGLLNAGSIQLTLHGRSKFKEIGCESIRVRRRGRNPWKTLFRRMFGRGDAELESGLIEGDDIDLEHAVVSVIRGSRVIVGPGCRIGRVEYRTELVKHPGAKIGEERKIGG